MKILKYHSFDQLKLVAKLSIILIVCHPKIFTTPRSSNTIRFSSIVNMSSTSTLAVNETVACGRIKAHWQPHLVFEYIPKSNRITSSSRCKILGTQYSPLRAGCCCTSWICWKLTILNQPKIKEKRVCFSIIVLQTNLTNNVHNYFLYEYCICN